MRLVGRAKDIISRVRFHDLRHSHATELLRGGAPRCRFQPCQGGAGRAKMMLGSKADSDGPSPLRAISKTLLLSATSGHVAEWLRNGLQNRVPRFNSGRGLH